MWNIWVFVDIKLKLAVYFMTPLDPIKAPLRAISRTKFRCFLNTASEDSTKKVFEHGQLQENHRYGFLVPVDFGGNAVR